MTYSCICRATDREQGQPRFSRNWVNSVKTRLFVSDDYIQCHPWKLKFSDLNSAHLYHVRTILGFPICRVLQVSTNEGIVQFGLNPWAKPHEYMPLEVTESKCRMLGKLYGSYSKLHIVLFSLIMFFLFLRWFAQ